MSTTRYLNIFTNTLMLLFLVLGGVSSSAKDSSVFDLNETKEIFRKIDKKANKKWNNFKDLQKDEKWIFEQSELGHYGTIFQKGWTSPRVERKIMPDKESGYLIIDNITVGANTMVQAATLTSNILLSIYFPYVQGGPILEKKFTSIKHVETYEQALKRDNFTLSKIPLQREDFQNLEDGESISTISTSGFFTRFSVGVLDLIEVSVPGGIDFGPKAKLHIQKSIKITITKENDDSAIISLENINERGIGLGTGLGIYFEDLINLPVTIGINGKNGYAPLLYNKKTSKTKVSNIVYKLDLNDERSIKAYHQFLNKDLTALQDLTKVSNSPVELIVKKEGEIKRKESSFGLDLILWRSGHRNINQDAKYTTTLSNGNKFKYREVELTNIKDRKGSSGKEKDLLQFSAIIPLQDSNATSFVLDTTYYYHDTKAFGKELKEVSRNLEKLGMSKGLPMIFSKKKKYGEVQMETKFRFSAPTMKKILEVDNETLYEAIATAMGYADPYILVEGEDREDLKKGNIKERLIFWKSRQVYKVFKKLRSKTSINSKAQVILKSLKHKHFGKLLHSTMINIVGVSAVMGQGYIHGI